MVHINNLKKYYFINEFNYTHLINLNKNISFIWRNKDKETSIKTLIELRDFCKKNQRCFYISNDIKLARKINADGAYISSTNKNLNLKTTNLKKNFRIIGSAHNLKEIKIKEIQMVNKIFLSSLFKKNKNFLGINKFKLLSKLSKKKIIALGGISVWNIKKLNLTNVSGYSGITIFKKKGPYK